MQENFKALLERYKAGTATEQDIVFLESWYLQYGEDGENEYAPEDQVADAFAVWEGLQSVQLAAKRVHLWPRIAAAVSIVLCLSIGGYLLLHKKDSLSIAANDHIGPAGNKATLTLANGKSIVLTTVKTGYLIRQPGTIINKVSDGTLLYKDQPGNKSAPVYDTLTTPRGGHFQLVLADGTKAWLNAATVIRYPENFSGNERRVEVIKGEAYFEVVHNSSKPFKVVARGQVIEDIGTHFNVNAYDDEPAVETTLLEGSVSVTDSKQRVILVPGQQSFLKKGSPIIVRKADLNEAVAWKDNHFIFSNDNIESIMRQISRWYNVDVSYQGDMSGKEITGSVSRSENISEVLRKLEETGTIHFKMDERRVIVMP
jgi:ferric-dicitrate binding protein FerR (iron transport regulator)